MTEKLTADLSTFRAIAKLPISRHKVAGLVAAGSSIHRSITEILAQEAAKAGIALMDPHRRFDEQAYFTQGSGPIYAGNNSKVAA